MSLLKKSQDLVIQQFLEEKILPFEKDGNLYKDFSLKNYLKAKEKNTSYEKLCRVFFEKKLFIPLNYPLKQSFVEKIDLLKKYLNFTTIFIFLVNRNLGKLKLIYSTDKALDKEYPLNPLLIKKMNFIKDEEIMKSLSFVNKENEPLSLYRVFAPRNSLIGLFLFKLTDEYDQLLIKQLLNRVFF